MLAVDPRQDFTIVAASRNVSKLLPASSLGSIIGQGITGILGEQLGETLRSRFDQGTLRGEAPWQITRRIADETIGIELAVHVHAGLIIIELEHADPQGEVAAMTSLRQLYGTIANLRSRSELRELARIATRGVRLLTGYERVLIYRFDADWNGQAIAEDKIVGWDQSLDGLHFPADDIPSQARELYRHSPMRWVADRDAEQVPLDLDPEWSQHHASSGIDLSFALLRSVSPMHLQYHRNMGVNGSMSLSIMHDRKLWGLMICHHRQPHYQSPGQRAAAEALTEAFGLRVESAERSDTELARRQDLMRFSDLLAHMAQADVVPTALTTGAVTISDLFTSTGAAVLYGSSISLLGDTPPQADVLALTIWLRARGDKEWQFSTGNMTALYPAWEPHTGAASGVLAVFLSPDRSDMLLWFRPEEPKLISWGGRPHGGTDGTVPFLPRQSFERWVETRHGHAKPWAAWELEMAESLRHAITEVIVRSLRRIAHLSDMLRQSQKMEAVGQLTGGLAHDFNNLLTGIVGSLELIGIRASQGRVADVNHYVTAAMTSAHRAASLTHRLLAFSRRQTIDPKPVNVAALAASLMDLIRGTVGPAIQVEIVQAQDLGPALCDGNQLENALLNLAINARDAMPSGGCLTIGLANAFLASMEGQYVQISVTDTGTGMPPDLMSRVFEPFFTTKPLGQGTGLGLSMVQEFARQSSGTTAITSEVGRGTTVSMCLPCYIGPNEAVAVRKIKPPITAKTGETILVVDDEPVLRLVIGEVLRDLGYEVIEATDGAEGLLVLRSERHVDLLIADVGLPGKLSGHQLADAAVAYQPGLKVLFITGYAKWASNNDPTAARKEVIIKPFAMEVLATKVRGMMES